MIHVLAIIAVVKAELLLPMRDVIRAVDVQDDLLGPALLAVLQVGLQQPLSQASEILRVHRVLQSRQRGLRSQIRIAFRQPITHGLEDGIRAQAVGIVAVLIAGHDLKAALGEQFANLVADVAAISSVLQAGGKASRQSVLLIQGVQTQQPGIGAEPASIESSHHFSVRVRWQVDLAD